MLKAYIVNSEYAEDSSSIQFAEHAVVARRNGLNDLNADSDCFAGSTCRRMPNLDKYGDAYEVPVRELIWDGWWGFECEHCGQRLEEYSMDEEDLPVADVVGTYRGACYCNTTCEENEKRYQHEKKNFEAIELDRFKAKLEVAHPPGIFYDDSQNRIRVTKKTDGWVTESVLLYFRFPGLDTPTNFEADYNPEQRKWDYGREYDRKTQAGVKPAKFDPEAAEKMVIKGPKAGHDAYTEWRKA